MSNSALIEDLERQFSENPRRVFARLANEYRKAGNLDGAIALCREHVPNHPGYISGHIVLGQSLFESGQLDEARDAFEAALQLDPENLIALRHLGDVARQRGDSEGARVWYGRVLDVDPQNEEAGAQLHALDSPPPTPAAPPVAADGHEGSSELVDDETRASEDAGTIEAATADSPEEPKAEQVSWSDINPETSTVSEEFDVTAVSADQGDAEAAQGNADAADAHDDLLSFGDADLSVPPAHSAPEVSPVDLDLDMMGRAEPHLEEGERDFAGAAGAPAPAAPPASEASTAASTPIPAYSPYTPDFEPGEIVPERDPFEEEEDRATPIEFSMPTEEIVTLEERTLHSQSAARYDEPEEEPFGWDSPEEHSESDVASDAGEQPQQYSEMRVPDESAEAPPPFVTETVAELYERQGHLQQSLEVYRELAAQTPGNEALRMHVERLESEIAELSARDRSGEGTIRSLFARVMIRRPPEGGNGTSTSSLFPGTPAAASEERAAAALAQAFAPDFAPPGSQSGRPARAAADELSLEAVFRDTAPRRRDANGVSFDQFFPDQTGGERGSSDPGGQDDGPGDDEVFHSWLDGLKR